MWYHPTGLNDALGHLRTIEVWERAEGSPAPLGATWVESEQAWNFACYSRHATGVVLLLYGEKDLATPADRICMRNDILLPGIKGFFMNRRQAILVGITGLSVAAADAPAAQAQASPEANPDFAFPLTYP